MKVIVLALSLVLAPFGFADETARDLEIVQTVIRHHFSETQPYVTTAVFDGKTTGETQATLQVPVPEGVAHLRIADLTPLGGPNGFDRKAFAKAHSDDAAFWVSRPSFAGNAEAEVTLIVWQRDHEGPLRMLYRAQWLDGKCRILHSRTL